jgi:hypothetical protein
MPATAAIIKAYFITFSKYCEARWSTFEQSIGSDRPRQTLTGFSRTNLKLRKRRLLPHNANHSRVIVDHIEFACRSTAHVDNAATTIRVTINLPLEAQTAAIERGHTAFSVS